MKRLPVTACKFDNTSPGIIDAEFVENMTTYCTISSGQEGKGRGMTDRPGSRNLFDTPPKHSLHL